MKFAVRIWKHQPWKLEHCIHCKHWFSVNVNNPLYIVCNYLQWDTCVNAEKGCCFAICIYIYILFIVAHCCLNRCFFLFCYSPFWTAYQISADRIHCHMAKGLKACNSLKAKRPTNNEARVCKWLYTTYSICNNLLAANNAGLPGYAVYCFIPASSPNLLFLPHRNCWFLPCAFCTL